MTQNPDTKEVLWTGIELRKLAPGRRHHFTPKQLKVWGDRGWITKDENTITLHTVNGDRLFHIDHEPGRYCLHCGEFLKSEEDAGIYAQGSPELGKAARAHVAKKHDGVDSPDPRHPSGYKYKHYWGATADDSIPDLSTYKIGA